MDQHIDAYIEFFLTSRQAAGRSPKTVQSYRWHLDVFRSWAEEEGLTDITAITIEDLERFIVFLRSRDTLFTNHPKRREEKRPLSAATIYGTIRALKTFFKFLARRRYLASDPAAGLVMPKKPKKLRPTIPLEAVESMLAAAQRGPCPTRDRALMLLLLDTGPRVSELCRLDIKDLDLEEGKMTILNGKGEKDRMVSITPRIISALAELVDDRPRQEPVFEQPDWKEAHAGGNQQDPLSDPRPGRVGRHSSQCPYLAAHFCQPCRRAQWKCFRPTGSHGP